MRSTSKIILASIALSGIPLLLKLLNTVTISYSEALGAFAEATIAFTLIQVFSSPISAFLISFIQKREFPNFLLSKINIALCFLAIGTLGIASGLIEETISSLSLIIASTFLYLKQANELPQYILTVRSLERTLFIFCPIFTALLHVKFNFEISWTICSLLSLRALIAVCFTSNYFRELTRTNYFQSIANLNASSAIIITYISAQTLYLFRDSIVNTYSEATAGLLFVTLQLSGMLMSGAGIFVNYATPFMFNSKVRTDLNVTKLSFAFLLVSVGLIGSLLINPFNIMNLLLNNKFAIITETYSYELFFGLAIYASSGLMTILQMKFQSTGKNHFIATFYLISFGLFLSLSKIEPYLAYFVYLALPVFCTTITIHYFWGRKRNV